MASSAALRNAAPASEDLDVVVVVAVVDAAAATCREDI